MITKTDNNVHDVKKAAYLTMTWKPKERKVKYTRYGVKKREAQRTTIIPIMTAHKTIVKGIWLQ